MLHIARVHAHITSMESYTPMVAPDHFSTKVNLGDRGHIVSTVDYCRTKTGYREQAEGGCKAGTDKAEDSDESRT